MLIFEKEKCFHGVWLHFKKFSGKYFLVFGKEEGKHKSRKTQATTQEKIINDDIEHHSTTAPSIAIWDRDQRRDRDLAFFARSRSSRDRAINRDLREIAINGDWNVCQRDHDRQGLEITTPCALSLSLSHFPEILWSENRSVNWFTWSKAFFFRSTDFNFRKIEFSGPTKQSHFWKSISGSDFHPKQTQSKSHICVCLYRNTNLLYYFLCSANHNLPYIYLIFLIK